MDLKLQLFSVPRHNVAAPTSKILIGVNCTLHAWHNLRTGLTGNSVASKIALLYERFSRHMSLIYVAQYSKLPLGIGRSTTPTRSS